MASGPSSALVPLALLRGVPATQWRVSLPLVCGVGAYAYALALGKGVLLDGDTLTHVAAGHWMLDYRVVPTHDPFSHTMAGRPWVAHEWLSELLMALAYDAGGFGALLALTGAAFAATVALLGRVLLRWLEPIYALLFVTFGFVMTAGHLLARPHILALPLLLWWTSELVAARAGNTSPRVAFAVPAMAIWANLHGGFTLGLLLAAVFALEAVIEAPRTGRRATALGWGRFCVLAAAAALLTPNGLDGVLFTWHVLTNLGFTLDRVGEWRSPDFHQAQPLEIWLLGALGFALLQGVRFGVLRVAVVLLLVHLSLRHVRNIELLGLLAPVVLAPGLAAHRRRTQAGLAQLEPADRLLEGVAAPAGRGAAAVAIVALAAATLVVDRMRPIAPPAPVQAVSAARAAHLPGNVLNSYSWGGYLAFIGIAPFIDGRADMYGDAHVRAYVDATTPASAAAMQRVLDEHRITWTLLEPHSGAIALLDLSPQWRRVFADDTAVVHARIRPLAPVLARHAGS